MSMAVFPLIPFFPNPWGECVWFQILEGLIWTFGRQLRDLEDLILKKKPAAMFLVNSERHA